MGYSSILDVKTVLQIKPTQTEDEAEINGCIVSADGLIDSILKYWGFSVPLSSPHPQNVKDASKYFAAWLYQRRQQPAGAQVFWDEGNRFLQAYIDAETEQPDIVRQA